MAAVYRSLVRRLGRSEMERSRSPKLSRRRSWSSRRRSTLAAASASSSSSELYASTCSAGRRCCPVDMLPPPMIAPPGRLRRPQRVLDDEVAEPVDDPPKRLVLDREAVEVGGGVQEVDRVQGAAPDRELHRVHVVAERLHEPGRLLDGSPPELGLWRPLHDVAREEIGLGVV